MHLLYLDDAGSAGNKNEEYLVLGGISVFEAQASFLTNELDKIASGFSATNPHDIEFHASEIFSRRAASRSPTTSTLNPCSSSATTVACSACSSGSVVKRSGVAVVLTAGSP